MVGAWIGVATGLTLALGGGLGLVVFLAGAFGVIYALEKTKDSSTGVWVLLGFTFFMGLMLSRMIAMVLGFKNGSQLVMTAFGGTAGVFFAMASLSTDVLTLTFNSLSKAYRACGYRAGWMVVSGDKSLARDYIEGLNMLEIGRAHV